MVVWCGEALAARAATRTFSVREMLAATQQVERDVLVVMEKCGELSLGAECVWARLSPHVAAPSGEVVLVGGGEEGEGEGGEVRLRVELRQGRGAGEELLLWPSAGLRARAGVPHLTPRNIAADGMYVCWSCGAAYSEPNPLKVHLYLACGAPSPAAFWRRVCWALCPAPCTTTAPAPRHSCPWCGRVYSRRYGLVIHCRTHTGARPLRCSHCGRRFADPSNLNKHRRLHDRDRDTRAPRTPAPRLNKHSPTPAALTTVKLLS